MEQNKDDILGDVQEVKSQTVKFSKVDDVIKGTLTGIKELDVKDMQGKVVRKKIREFKAIAGFYHESDPVTYAPVEPKIDLIPGEYYKFWSRGEQLEDDLKKIKIGQIFAVKFLKYGEKKPGKQAPKIMKVFFGEMDPEFEPVTNGLEDIPFES